MTTRFLHASDLHLGKPFGGFPEDVRHRLREARHGAIARLAQAARMGGAATVLLAGDTFDAETPSPQTLRHALRGMADAADICWVLLPGNHDSLAATELWRRVGAEGPSNVQAVLSPVPLTFAPGVYVLGAPCTQRRPGRDLTEAMDAATPDGAIRIGLGHGAVTDFSGEQGVAGIIPPDRAMRSGLDYLALGDWHGRLQVAPNTWYAGTPEPDSFKHAQSAGALLVDIDTPRRAVRVTVAETGIFQWQVPRLDILPGDDVSLCLQAALPPGKNRRDMLISLIVTGRVTLAGQSLLKQELDRVAADFGWFGADLAGLTMQAHADDLDAIDRMGALRVAAETLLAESQDATLAQDMRDEAAVALSQLYSFALDDRA